MSFNFGNQTSLAKTTSFNFGGVSAPGTSFSSTVPTGVVQPTFGTLASTAASVATGTSGFGTNATPPTAIVGAQPQASSGFSLSAGATVSKPTSLGVPSLFNTSATPSFGLTSTVQQNTQQPTSLNFGAPGAITTTTAASTSTGLGGTTLGLGGTLNTSLATNPTTESNQATSQNVKESNIPNELLVTVEDFKKYVKEERGISSDIAHTSVKVHDKISEEINGLNQLVNTLSTGLAKNCMLLDKIKMEAAQEIQNAEIAQRTRDTPPGLQYENLAPYDYFSTLLSKFETQMLHYRRQIEETEQHLHSMTTGQQLSPEDISRALQKLHTAFIALAGQYQTIHEAVLSQSESFLQWHRQRYGTTVEVFGGSNKKKDNINNRSAFALGPSPFGKEK